MVNEQQVIDALKQIDTATTQIGANLAAISTTQTQIATVTGTISTEVDALVKAMQGAGVSQALLDQATALGAKADAASVASTSLATATAALVPVLEGIAAKGVIDPVPVQPPPAPQPAP